MAPAFRVAAWQRTLRGRTGKNQGRRKRTLRYLVILILCSAAPELPAAGRALADAQAVPHLNAQGRQEYRKFLKAESPRAFVLAPGGAWAWHAGGDSPDAALAAALADCEEHTEQRCVPYALDEKVVLDEKAWPGLWAPYKSAFDAARAPEGTRRGERFPDLALTDPAGRPFKVSDLRGRVVLLHFWGTWCPSCVHELPQFAPLRSTLADVKDLVFVFSQVREPAEAARRWLQRRKLALPLYDSGARGGADDRLRLADGRRITDRVLAPGFPTTYVLDRHGLVVFSHRGSASDWRQYAPFLHHLALHAPK